MKGLFEKAILGVEKAGFKTANFVHKTTITMLILGTCYGFYALMRDYRAYFLMRRDPKYAEYLEQRDKLFKSIIESEPSKRERKPNS
jgi:hypothetical protein